MLKISDKLVTFNSKYRKMITNKNGQLNVPANVIDITNFDLKKPQMKY